MISSSCADCSLAMDKQDLIDCFNDNLRKFVSELSALYANDADLNAFNKALSLAIVVDDRKPFKLYHKLANVPYGEFCLVGTTRSSPVLTSRSSC